MDRPCPHPDHPIESRDVRADPRVPGHFTGTGSGSVLPEPGRISGRSVVISRKRRRTHGFWGRYRSISAETGNSVPEHRREAVGVQRPVEPAVEPVGVRGRDPPRDVPGQGAEPAVERERRREVPSPLATPSVPPTASGIAPAPWNRPLHVTVNRRPPSLVDASPLKRPALPELTGTAARSVSGPGIGSPSAYSTELPPEVRPNSGAPTPFRCDLSGYPGPGVLLLSLARIVSLPNSARNQHARNVR